MGSVHIISKSHLNKCSDRIMYKRSKVNFPDLLTYLVQQPGKSNFLERFHP